MGITWPSLSNIWLIFNFFPSINNINNITNKKLGIAQLLRQINTNEKYDNDYLHGIDESADGNYIMVGEWFEDDTDGDQQLSIAKINKNDGTMMWSRLYGSGIKDEDGLITNILSNRDLISENKIDDISEDIAGIFDEIMFFYRKENRSK